MYEEINKLDYSIPIRLEGTVIPPETEANSFKYLSKRLSGIHLHNEYEFLRINRGIIRCTTIEGDFFAQEGDIVFINRYTPHSTYMETDNMHITLLQFRLGQSTDSLTRYISRFTDISGKSIFVIKSDTAMAKELHRYLNIIVEEYTEKKPYWSDYIYSNLLTLMAAIRRNGILSDSIDMKKNEIKKIWPVLEYISKHYDENLSTAVLSRIFNFNEAYFCRLFKNIVKASPMTYINYVRICKAEKLLKKDVDILSVALETGFSSLSYFNRVFKKYNHYSPSEYRIILKHQEEEYTSGK